MKKVIIYSAPWCSFCSAEKDWLEHNGIAFEEKDIEEQDAAGNFINRDEVIAKMKGNFQGIPVTDIDGEIVVGFDRPKLSQLLEIKRF
ncbi:MAG: glutaredoxin domain-containing protein [bacterium]|nr:glutaredoxin domain-containing protein [bacterium]